MGKGWGRGTVGNGYHYSQTHNGSTGKGRNKIQMLRNTRQLKMTCVDGFITEYTLREPNIGEGSSLKIFHGDKIIVPHFIVTRRKIP